MYLMEFYISSFMNQFCLSLEHLVWGGRFFDNINLLVSYMAIFFIFIIDTYLKSLSFYAYRTIRIFLYVFCISLSFKRHFPELNQVYL